MAYVKKRDDDKEYWVAYIHQRIRNNKNFVCFIQGPTGSGKTYAAISIAEMLDDKFKCERIVFSGKELMGLLNKKHLRRGSVIVFEEVGIEMDAAKWQSTTNQMLKYLFETFRHRGLIVIMTAPYMDYLAKGSRMLVHAIFETAGIDYKNEVCKLKPQLLQYNSRYNKWYYKYLKMKVRRGRFKKIRRWGVSKPSPPLLSRYEKKKRDFTDALNKRILQSFEDQDKVKGPPEANSICYTKDKQTEQVCGYSFRCRTAKPGKCPKCQGKYTRLLKKNELKGKK
jgi:hypothetical protein